MIFGNLFKKDLNPKVAIIKQEAVFDLWRIQQHTFQILDRCLKSGAATQSEFQSHLELINQRRQASQDQFLLELSLDRLQEQIQKMKSDFTKFTENYIEQSVARERQIQPEDRVNNINNGFRNVFKELYSTGKINRENLMDLEVQVEMYKKGIRQSLDMENLNEKIKIKLAHEMIDDYYDQINQIYLNLVSKNRRM